ncbi:hypothetical protein DAMA08_010440 [Martiniozyma asiatica (nom. inval.)]|nr:hypothetical protein DAMA08_010440 [Martiniozyma asiatica]
MSPVKIPTELIILPCHSIYTPAVDLSLQEATLDNKAGTSASDWILASFQHEASDHLSFIQHIRLAAKLNDGSENSLLIISGGYTKQEVEFSEARSYFGLGVERGYFEFDSLNKNIILEEYARDSYENVLFSLCAFHKKYGAYPAKVSIVGFEFKKPRFVESHLKTLGYIDSNKVSYIGSGPDYPLFETLKVVNPQLTQAEWKSKKNSYFDELVASENKFALNLFDLNPFGSKGSKLWDKKQQRDPWGKSQQISSIYGAKQSGILSRMINIDNIEFEDAKRVYELVKEHFPL